MKYKVDSAKLTITEDEELVGGSVKIYETEFLFDDTWVGYTKVAVFKRGGAIFEQLLTDNKCEIPWEVLENSLIGDLYIGIRGISGEKIRPTQWANPKAVYRGADEGNPTREPTPDILQQMLNRVENEMLDAIKEHNDDASAHENLKSISTALTLTPTAWVDDSDIDPTMEIRMGYRKNDKYEAQTFIRDAYNTLLLTYEWQDFVLPFTLAENASRFVPFFQGSWSTTDVHPYDIMACKLYAADDATKTNILDDDIEMQDWVSEDGLSETALFITDGVRYKHVFRQEKNYAEVRAISRGRAIILTAGDYIFECRLRLTPWLRFISVPVIEAHSENCVTVSPSNDTAEAYASHNIRCEAFGSETLIFSCDEIPSVDIKANAMVTKSTGAEGLIFQPPRASVYGSVVDAALLDTIGSGVIE